MILLTLRLRLVSEPGRRTLRFLHESRGRVRAATHVLSCAGEAWGPISSFCWDSERLCSSGSKVKGKPGRTLNEEKKSSWMNMTIKVTFLLFNEGEKRMNAHIFNDIWSFIPVDNTIDLSHRSTAFPQACFCDNTIGWYRRFHSNSIMLLLTQKTNVTWERTSHQFCPWVGLDELNGSSCISSLLWMDEKVSSALHTTDKRNECL